MAKFLVICATIGLLLFFGLLFLLPFFHRDERRVSIIAGEQALVWAYNDYTNSGVVTNDSRTYQVWLSSNKLSIGGTQYQCLLELRSDRLADDGTLAMTTNRTFIWLDRNGPAKIIPAGYKPPLFGY
jgi:hypothetical protein